MRIDDKEVGPLSPEADQEEMTYESNLRPRTLDEFVGQQRTKENR